MTCTACQVRRFIARRGWTVARLCQEIDAADHEVNISRWLRKKAPLDDTALLGRMTQMLMRLNQAQP